MGAKLGGLVCLALALAGCASEQKPPAAPARVTVSTDALVGLRQSVDELQAAAAHTCEQGCVSLVIGQCVVLAVESVDLVNPQCVNDKSRACLLNCTP